MIKVYKQLLNVKNSFLHLIFPATAVMKLQPVPSQNGFTQKQNLNNNNIV